MTGQVADKVAFITGAARGQGRAHAVRLAQEGADIIAVDICGQIASVPYPMATEDDLQQTVRQVEALGRRIFAVKADVRDFDALASAAGNGVAALGRLDIVSANAGIFGIGAAVDLSEAAWRDMLDVNLTGVWHTIKATVPHIVAGGRGGSIVLTSSSNGVVGAPMYAHYVAAKHGVVGLVRALAQELAPDLIRINGLVPAGVATDMVRNLSDVGSLSVRYTEPEAGARSSEHPLKDILLGPSDVSDALLFLASDLSRYVTGSLLHVEGMKLAQVERSRSRQVS